MTERPPITCHVLDTTIGRPGAGIPVSLTYLGVKGQSQSSGTTFTATTNDDGRVTQWTAEGSSAGSTTTTTLEEIFASGGGAAGTGPLRWVLGFDTEAYFARRGVEAFFAEVEVKFVTRKEQIERKEHFHVPVLLGPFGYTTYRGS